MEFKEKNRTARELASPEFIEKDRNLLESIHPGHELLSRCNIASRRETLDSEILYILLDSFTPEEIINYRFGVNGNPNMPEKDKIPAERPESPKKSHEGGRVPEHPMDQSRRRKHPKSSPDLQRPCKHLPENVCH